MLFKGITQHYLRFQADISIAINPLLSMKSGQSKPSFLGIGASLNSVTCALSLQLDTSIYSITQIIREARTLSINGRQV